MSNDVSSSGAAERTAREPGSGSGEQESSRSLSSTPDGRARPREGAEMLQAISGILGEATGEADPEADGREERAGRAESVLEGRDARSGDEDGAGDDEPPAAAPKPARPRNLREAAESLGILPEEVYDLDVPLGDGETIKLGALKDQHAERRGLEQEIARRQAAADGRESAIRGAETRLVEVFDIAKSAFSPGIQEQIGNFLTERQQAREAREAMALRRALPELSDEGFTRAFQEHIAKAGQEFGFSPHELAELRDHRYFLVLKRNMDLEKRVARLTAVNPKPLDKSPQVIGAKGRDARGRFSAEERARRSGREADVVRGVSELIGRTR